MTTCPTNSYSDTSNKECKECHSSCLTCNGSSSNKCLTCKMISGNQYYFNSNNNTCTATCTLNYYNAPSSTFICDQCDVACRTCSDTSSNTACIHCNEAGGYHLAAATTNTCVLGCTSTQFVTGTPKICTNCHSNCLTCITSATNCLSCGM
jgi:proprotein convertase subtilisin/kexin type 5